MTAIPRIIRRLLMICVIAMSVNDTALSQDPPRLPNIVVIFTDDMGYADAGCFGAKGWTTPNIDRIAKEGIKFTSFHVAQPVCSASRAALLTGCYPNRIGIHGALGPGATHGINDNEVTLAELCRSKGYATGMVGKWHLGHHPQFLPTHHGFDSYLGLPYSNDMWPHHPEAKKGTYPKLPLIDGDRVLDPEVTPDDQTRLTQMYTDRAVKFIHEHKSKPFFLYFAHSFPHVPLYVGESFRNRSKEGLYGDVIQEIDHSVGAVLKALNENKLDGNTLVIFTSDNGPWLSYGNHGGRAGSLREGKGTIWEGGIRVPFVAKWPGHIPPGSVCDIPVMSIDLFPTIAAIIGAELPKHPIDGKSILPLLEARPGAKSPQEAYRLYYKSNELQGVMAGQWKLLLPHRYRTMNGQTPGKDGIPGKYRQQSVKEPELYDLGNDPNETTNVAAMHPEIVKKLMKSVEAARQELGDSLTKRQGSGNREPGRVKK